MASLQLKEFMGRSVAVTLKEPPEFYQLQSHVRLLNVHDAENSVCDVRVPVNFARGGGPSAYLWAGACQVNVRSHDGATLIGSLAQGEVGELLKTDSGWILINHGAGASSTAVTAPTEDLDLVLGPGLIPDVNLLTEAQNELGYGGVLPAKLKVTILPGTMIYSNSAGQPALNTGAWPSGSVIELTNRGEIRGRGGDGADPSAAAATSTGSAGGSAMLLQTPTILDNTEGLIFGGGGGGGAFFSADATERSSAGGGGGGAGFPGGQGGTGGRGSANVKDGRAGNDQRPGFGGKADMSIAPGGHNGLASLTKALFSPRAGGQGGFPGMRGVDYNGLFEFLTGRTGGAPGAIAENAQHLSFTNNTNALGKLQGWLWDTTTDTFTIYVGHVAGPINVRNYMLDAGWDGASVINCKLFVQEDAIVFNPRNLLWEGDAANLFENATVEVPILHSGSTMLIENRGSIFGAAGWGGSGGRSSQDGNAVHEAMNGDSTRVVMAIAYATTLTNYGEILASGGGGGGGPAGAQHGTANDHFGGAGGAGQGQPLHPLLLPVPSSYRREDTPGARYAYYGLDDDGRQDDSSGGPAYFHPDDTTSDSDARASAPGSGQQGFVETTEARRDNYGGDGGAYGAGGGSSSGNDTDGFSHKGGGDSGGAISGIAFVSLSNAGTIVGAQY